jgi:hypothetical protein
MRSSSASSPRSSHPVLRTEQDEIAKLLGFFDECLGRDDWELVEVSHSPAALMSARAPLIDLAWLSARTGDTFAFGLARSCNAADTAVRSLCSARWGCC